jgi:hypothetical protein
MKRALSLGVLLLAALLTGPVLASADDRIGLIVPAFEGEGVLGRNVTAVTQLQVWQTLRRAPTPNPRKLDFGSGTIIMWSDDRLASPNHEFADNLAMGEHLQMTLWGSATPYGKGVVVQTYLSIPDYEDGRDQHNERWTVTMPLPGKKEHTISADIPRRRYEFSPIVLTAEVVNTYSSPRAVKVFREKSLKTPLGVLGNNFEARQHEGDLVLIKTGDLPPGWVHLPRLSRERNEVVDFVGGLIRVFRGDWEGVIVLMNRVILAPRAPVALKVDAWLYIALAHARQGQPFSDAIAKAQRLNPYSREVAVYAVMGEMEQAAKALREKRNDFVIADAILRIETILQSNRNLFAADDSWLAQVRAILHENQGT